MKRILLAGIAAAALAATAAVAMAASIGVGNGGFESGSLAPWTAIDQGAGAWGIDTGDGRGNTCADALDFPGPRSGTYDALYDQADPTWGVLYQDMVVPADATNLTLALIWENDIGAWALYPSDPYDLSLTHPNQWLSVDVLKAGADPKTLDAGDVIKTVVRHTSGSSDSLHDWSAYSVNLAAYAGQKVRLRIVAVDNVFCLPFAVDDVSFRSTEVQDERIAYCSVAGNTWPDGTPIAPGTFLNLEAGQPSSEPGYAGAVPANYVAGTGLTCAAPPAGDTLQGTAGAAQHVAEGVYPYYAPPPS
jgi:hypothetical protein